MKTVITIMIFFGTCLAFACSESLSIDNSEVIPHQEILLKCLSPRTTIGEHIITNNDSYQILLKEISPHPDCIGYELPEINFNQYTLVGYGISIAGCKTPKMDYKITKTGNNYTIKINIEQQGSCLINFSLNMWCLIPKIEEGSSVKFELFKTVKKD